eukprot:266321_1
MDTQKRIGWIQRHKLSKDVGNCGICLDSLKNGRDLVYALKCHHVFHNNCLNDYCEYGYKGSYQKTLCCPLCRRKNTPDINEATDVWTYKNKCLDPDTTYKLISY